MTDPSPVALLVTSRRWVQTAHLALAARRAGFAVSLMAPPGHPIARLDWVSSAGIFSLLRPSASVARALERGAQVVIPVDELALDGVFDAYLEGRLSGTAGETVVRSLGDPTTFRVRHDRAGFAAILRDAGLPVAPTRPVPTEAQLDAALASSGLPAVLKVDGSFGGRDVVVVRDGAGAHAAYLGLRRAEPIVTSFGRMVRDDDATLVRAALTRRRGQVSVQPYIEGERATISAVSWQGVLLGATAFRVVTTSSPAGPATVVEPIDHPGMRAAAAASAAALTMSGLFGIDFLLTADGEAVVLELNARATPTSHLCVDGHPSLVGLLAAQVGVAAVGTAPNAGPASPIALFPQERLRDPGSPFVGNGHEDVPVDADDLVELCLRSRPTGVPSIAARIRRRWTAVRWTVARRQRRQVAAAVPTGTA